MTMLPPDCVAINSDAATRLEKLLRSVSVLTMLMTIPQVLTVWSAHNAGGVSVISWAAYLLSACLWFVYGVRKRDRTIYIACIGWIILDAAVVAGAIVHG